MKQVVKKAAELGFTIIGYHQDENLISNSDLTNLANLIEKLLIKMTLQESEKTLISEFLQECIQRKVVNGPNMKSLFEAVLLNSKRKFEENSTSDPTLTDDENEIDDIEPDPNKPFTNDSTFKGLDLNRSLKRIDIMNTINLNNRLIVYSHSN